MYYATIKNCDIANGPGVRVSLFVSGCTHHCPECFNEVAWDFCYGQPFTEETIQTILDMLRPAFIRGLTLLGGEPFEPQNQGAVVELLCWWTAPLSRKRKISASGSGDRKISGSSTCPNLWPREKPSCGRTGRGTERE